MMISSLVNLLFGCSHSNYSFPQTVKPGQRRTAATSVTGTYVACLSCGKEFAYDWRTMKIVAPAKPEQVGEMPEAIPFASKKAA